MARRGEEIPIKLSSVIKFVLNRPGAWTVDRRDHGTTNKIFYFNEIKFYCLHGSVPLSLLI